MGNATMLIFYKQKGHPKYTRKGQLGYIETKPANPRRLETTTPLSNPPNLTKTQHGQPPKTTLTSNPPPGQRTQTLNHTCSNWALIQTHKNHNFPTFDTINNQNPQEIQVDKPVLEHG
ncbi:hypothetical protein Drorol1_Dr00014698 [Drosera rotundifolia]